MAKGLPYRKASGEPAVVRRGAGWVWRRYLLPPLFVIALLAGIFVVAGGDAGAVLQTWVAVIFVLPIIVAAAMLGVAITGPWARRGVFSPAAYPDLFRLIVSVALGLGTLALAMLLLGSLHLIEPFHTFLTAPPHLPAGGYPWVPVLLLLLAAGIGFLPSRHFLKTVNWVPFKKPIRRGDWLILLAALPVAVMVVAATYPPGTLWASEGNGYDVLEYHLELPREYAANNSTAPLTHNVYSYFPQNIEMLYLLTTQAAKFGMGDGARPAAVDGYLWGVYPCQFLHVILMLLAAGALGLAPRRMSTAGRFLAIVLFLAIPWTVVTGSLAYNEGGMMLFGILALGLALQNPARAQGAGGATAGRMILLGIFLGLAVGCKMTAGVFFALPVAGILLLQGMRNWPRILLAALVAGAVYLPWAVRAAIYSGGNPVFPIASSIFPRDGWTAAQSARFIRGHSAQRDGAVIPLWDAAARGAALWRESVLSPQWSPGYASIYRWSHEKWEDAWWKELGILWLVVGPAILLAVLGGLREKSPAEGGTGGVGQVFALLLMLVVQVLAWMFLTHVQSRFLLPVAAPLALLVALGAEGLGENVGGLPVGLARTLIVTVVGLQALCSVFLLLPETGLLLGSPREQPIGELFEREVNWAALAEAGGPGEMAAAAKDLPVGKILLVGGITPLFDAGAIEYNTVFDRNWFAVLLAKDTPAETVAALRVAGINDVVIDWDEIARLRDSYGYEDSVTPAAVEALEGTGLRVVAQAKGWVVLEVMPGGK